MTAESQDTRMATLAAELSDQSKDLVERASEFSSDPHNTTVSRLRTDLNDYVNASFNCDAVAMVSALNHLVQDASAMMLHLLGEMAVNAATVGAEDEAVS